MATPVAITLVAPTPPSSSAALTGGYEYNRQIAAVRSAGGSSPSGADSPGGPAGHLRSGAAARYRWVAPAHLGSYLSGSGGVREAVLVDSLFFAYSQLTLPRRPPRAPVALLCHVVPWEQWPDDDVSGSLAWLAGAVTTSGATVAAAAAGLGRRGCGGPVLAVPPGVDLRRFAPADAEGGGPPAGAATKLITVANVCRDKGHLHLLEALAQLTHHRWRWRIVGDLSQEPDTVRTLRRRAAALGVEGRLDLVGSVAGAALVGCYRDADVAVYPTLRESYGMAIVEALACGVPVLASDVGGVAEAVGGSGAAQLLSAGDPAAWVAALGRLMARPGERRRLATTARGERGDLRSWDDAAATLTAAAAQLVSAAPSRL